MAQNNAKASAKARRDEAKPEEATPTTFTFNDRVYSVPPEAIDNVELFEAVEDQKYLTAARGFIGREQWEAFKDDHRTDDGRVPMAPVEEFLDALMKAVGSGNSSGSQRS